MPLTTLSAKIEQAMSFEEAVQVLYARQTHDPLLKVGHKTQGLIYDKFFADHAKRFATSHILTIQPTLSLKWLVALCHYKAQHSEKFKLIIDETKAAIKEQQEDKVEIKTLSELLNLLSPSSNNDLFYTACLKIKRLFRGKALPETINNISDQLSLAIDAYQGNANSPIIRKAAITFIQQAFTLSVDAIQGKPINPAMLNATFNTQDIAKQALQSFISEQISLSGETFVLFIDALTNFNATAKLDITLENHLSAMQLSKKILTDITLQQIAQALHFILSRPCPAELASTLIAGLVFQVKQLRPSADEAKVFLSQLNSFAVYSANGERNTTWLTSMVNSVAIYAKNEDVLIAQLLDIAKEQKDNFKQRQQHIASSSEASSSYSPATSPSTSPKRKKLNLDKPLTQLRDKKQAISADFILQLFERINAIPENETVTEILNVLPTRLEGIPFSTAQIKTLLSLFKPTPAIEQDHFSNSLLTLLSIWLKTTAVNVNDQQEIKTLLNHFPNQDKKKEILKKLK